MATRVEELERYYDYHPREDEEVGQGYYHQAALEYLTLVLKWLYYAQLVGIGNSINVYHEAVDPKKAPAPDVAVIDGVQIDDREPGQVQSHFVGRDGPPPRVVFEVSSESTWPIDLGVDRKTPVEDQKPALYERMGIQEYFAFDPNRPTLWTREWKAQNRLVGWRLTPETQQYDWIEKNEQGWLWSEQLESWLGVDRGYLRLYTREGQMRLTEAEAQKQRADQEAQRAIAEQRRADALETEARLRAELLEKLRSKGIDPETL